MSVGDLGLGLTRIGGAGLASPGIADRSGVEILTQLTRRLGLGRRRERRRGGRRARRRAFLVTERWTALAPDAPSPAVLVS